jgi:E3 ubiquitin-protein ligase UBR1
MFRPPEGPTETGLYELREEAYEEANRFYLIIQGGGGYCKKTGKKEWEIVLELKGFGVKGGPFKDLSNIWEQEVILQVVFFAIWNVLVITDTISSLSSDVVTRAGAGAAPPSSEANFGPGFTFGLARYSLAACWI